MEREKNRKYRAYRKRIHRANMYITTVLEEREKRKMRAEALLLKRLSENIPNDRHINSKTLEARKTQQDKIKPSPHLKIPS